MRLFTSFLLLLIFVPAQAAVVSESKDAVSAFAQDTTATFVICSLEVELGLLKGQTPDITFACIDKFKLEMKPGYAKAKSKLIKNKEALDALKELYAYWLTSMVALVPATDEPKFQYKRRIEERIEVLHQRANRLRIEANIAD